MAQVKGGCYFYKTSFIWFERRSKGNKKLGRGDDDDAVTHQ